MKRLTIIASGTRGDVQPAIALGKALQIAEYRVCILVSPDFSDWIEGHGLKVVPLSVNIQTLIESEEGRE